MALIDIEPGLTREQEALLKRARHVQIEVPLRRRFFKADGTPIFSSRIRLVHPFEFQPQPGQFVLKSHEADPLKPLAPYYFTLRKLPDYFLTHVAEVIAQTISDVDLEYCTGVPNSGEVIAQRVAEISDRKFVKLLEKVEDPNGRKIVPLSNAQPGYGRKYRHLMLIEDVISTAASVEEAIDALTPLGYEVDTVAALVDRQEGGRQKLEAQNCQVYPALTITQILNFYYKRRTVNKNQYQCSLSYLKKAS